MMCEDDNYWETAPLLECYLAITNMSNGYSVGTLSFENKKIAYKRVYDALYELDEKKRRRNKK